MSHYEFLKTLQYVVYLHEPIYYEDGSFTVMVEDGEGWRDTIVHFDKNGNMIKEDA